MAAVLGTYALGLVASSSLKLFASGFHALQDTRTPMLLAAVSVTVGIGFAVMFTLVAKSRLPAPYRPFAAMGIALGGAIGAWINLLLLWSALDRKLGGLFDRAAAIAAVRLVAGVGMAAFAVGASRAWLGPRWPGSGFVSDLALLATLAAVGAVPYLLIARRPPTILPEEGRRGEH